MHSPTNHSDYFNNAWTTEHNRTHLRRPNNHKQCGVSEVISLIHPGITRFKTINSRLLKAKLNYNYDYLSKMVF